MTTILSSGRDRGYTRWRQCTHTPYYYIHTRHTRWDDGTSPQETRNGRMQKTRRV